MKSSRRSLSLSFLLSSFVAFAGNVRAQWSNIQEGLDAKCVYDAGGEIGEVATIEGFECLIFNILRTATTFIGLAAFVMLIVGAFLFLTSGGSPKGAETGRQTMTYAVIGIVVALSATFILNLIAGFTGVGTIFNFDLSLE